MEGYRIVNFRYADDTVVLTSSREELKNVININGVSEKYRLKLNKNKTKVMIVDGAKNHQPEVRNVAGYETVIHFNYLCSLITNQGDVKQKYGSVLLWPEPQLSN